MASSLNNPAWLEWMTTLMGEVSPAGVWHGGLSGERVSEERLSEERLSRSTYAATFPPDRFYCLLDELPLHLLPQHASRLLEMQDDRPLYLNPECLLGRADQTPEELASHEDLLSRFALQGSVAWVPDRATGNLLPFWLGPQLETVLRDLRPNEPVPSSVAEEEWRLLAAAHILVPEDPVGHNQREHEEKVKKASSEFREKGYAPLGDLIHPFHVAALRRYYRYLIRSGAIRLGDGQSPRRYVAYNEPAARFFHHHIAAALSAVAGEPLKPSYVYFASYLSGAELKKHTDREQCEFSVTLCLDFSPEPALATPWPIRMDTPAGTVTIYQALGDGLAYRGTRLPHYRETLGAGQTSTSIFFHYVGADFAGSLD
jgi:hypothetical protein